MRSASIPGYQCETCGNTATAKVLIERCEQRHEAYSAAVRRFPVGAQCLFPVRRGDDIEFETGKVLKFFDASAQALVLADDETTHRVLAAKLRLLKEFV